MPASKTDKISDRLSVIEPNDKEISSMTDVQEATLVKTKEGLPDMRFKEHRTSFLIDSNLRLDGRPDERLLVNRTDLQALHEKRGEDKPNFIFTRYGEIR